MKVSRRLIAAVIVSVALFASACSDATDPEAVASSLAPAPTTDSSSEQQTLTPTEVAELQTQAIERACETRCAGRAMWVRVRPWPVVSETVDAIGQRYPDASFLSPTEDPPGSDPSVFDDGANVVASVGPMVQHPNNVVGFEVGTSLGRDYFATEYLFKWDDSQWQPTTPEDAGVTVTSAVS